MTSTLDYVSAHRGAIVLLLVLAFGLVGIVQWVTWIFRMGRFGVDTGQNQQSASRLGYVVVQFFIKLINDFRHLLALVIVSLFAFSLAVAMYPGVRLWDVELIGKGVQAVAAALGGLIGSIVGYYFGESAAAQRTPAGATKDVAPVQAPPISAIEAAPALPSAKIETGPPTA